MNTVIVDLAAAVICFASSCYNALIGAGTPVGEFQLVHYSTQESGYGGDILAFKETQDSIYAIHRVLDLPGQQRLARIYSPYPQHRVGITAGCVNVAPEVFEKLVDCCSDAKVIIK